MNKSPTAGVLNEAYLIKNPEQIFKNGKLLQKLAVMQVVAMTIMTSFDFIVSERPHCTDRLL